MPVYLSTAINILRCRDEWIQRLPQALLSPGETWDSLIDELLDLGLFVEVPEAEIAEDRNLIHESDWISAFSMPPNESNPTEAQGALRG